MTSADIELFAAGVFWSGLALLALLAVVVYFDNRKRDK